MEVIKRACALGGVSVQAAPVEPRTTQSVPFMQMMERTDSKIVARKDDHIKVTALKFNGMMDSLEKFIDRLSKSFARSVKIKGRKLDRDRDSKDRDRRSNTESRDNRDSRNSRDSKGSYRSDSDSAQKMIDKGLEVGIVLEVGLEVEEELSRPVFIATSQTMNCLIVIDFPKT